MEELTVKKQSVLTNAGWFIGCKLVKAILTMIVTMITARYLGPSNLGIIKYAAGLAAFLVPLTKLGLDSIIVHEVVTHPEKEGETIGTSITLSFLSSFLCMVGMLLFVLVVNAGQTMKIIVCGVYSLMLVFQALELIQYWFHAKLMAKYISTAMLVSYIIVSAVEILLLVLGAELYWIALFIIADYLVISIILWIQYRRKGTQKLRFSRQRAGELLQESKYYILSAMMVTIFAQIDTIMISFMIDDAATGLYAAAVTCATMTSFVFAALIDSMRPVIFKRLKEKDIAGYEDALTMLYSVVTYLSLLQSVVLTVFAGLIVKIMYGADYAASVPALQIICWYVTFNDFGVVRNIWILAEGKQKYLWRINLIGAAANVLLNAILIPLMGICGAALASLVTQFFTNIVVSYLFKPIRYSVSLMLRGWNPKCMIRMYRLLRSRV